MKTKKSKVVKKVKITKVKPEFKVNNKVNNKTKKVIRVASKSNSKKKFSFVKPQGIDSGEVTNKEIVKEKTFILRSPIVKPVVKQENKVYSTDRQFKQRLEFLSPGETFEILSLKNIKRNGVFLFSTPAASLIKIDNYDQHKEIWNNNCREYCANSVEVIVTGKVNLVTSNSGIIDVEGSIEIDELGETIQRKRGRKKLHAAAPAAPELDSNGNKIIKTRGRKAKDYNIILPKKDWTIKQAAELNKVENHTIVNFMNKQKSLGVEYKIVKQLPQPSGRGRPTNVFKGVK